MLPVVRALVILAAAAVYALAFWRIDCPGLYYDEVFFVAGWYPDGAFTWRPGGVPLMQLPYLGAFKTWLYWPWAAQLSPALVRVPPLLVAALSIALVYGALRRLAGRRAAELATVLLLIDPAFLFLQRLDWGPVTVGIVLRSAVLLLLARWREDGAAWRLWLAGLLVGLGLYDKITFAWFLVGLAAAVLATRREWPRPRMATLSGAFAALVLGAAPLLAFNLLTARGTLGSEVLGSGAWHALDRVPTRLAMVADTFAGRSVYELVNARAMPEPLVCPGLGRSWAFLCGAFPLDGSWMPIAVLAALGATLVLAPLRRDFACRFLAVLLVVTAATFLPIPLGNTSGVASDVGPHHAAVLLPVLVMLLAAVGVRAARVWPRWRPVLAAGLVLVVVSSAAVTVRTAASFAGACGRGRWSAAIYEARDFVRRHPGDRFLVADWGFYTQLRTLAPSAWLDDVSWTLQRGDVDPMRFQPSSGARTFLLFHRRGIALFPAARRRALAFVRRAGLHVRRGVVLRDVDGSPTGDVVEIVSPVIARAPR